MDNELEVIRDEMELTRANLATKLGALENQVRETVSGATDAVSSTVEGVKDVVSSVSETVETVTETFNVSKQVEQHPWMAVGAAVAAGFVLAQVLGRASHSAPAHHYQPPAPPEPHRQPSAAPAHEESHKDSGVLHSIGSMLPDMSGVMNTVTSSLGGLAVGGLMGVIRELASNGLPEEWKGEATKLIDQVTTQLGGKPLDSAKSSNLLDVLGLGGKSHESQDQGGQSQGVQTQLSPAKQQQPGQGSSLSGEEELGSGTRGMRSAGRQPTTQTW